MEPGLPQFPNPCSFVWFSLICTRRRGSTAVVARRDTVVDESREKMAGSVTRSQVLLCSRDGKLCYYRRLEFYIFTFVPCFFIFLFLLSWSRCVSLLRVPLPVQQSSATVQQVVRFSFFVSFVSSLLSEFLYFCLFSDLSQFFHRWGCCSAFVPGTLAIDLATLILSWLWVFLSHSLWPRNLCRSWMKNQDGHWVYCWCRWVERTV